MLAKCPKCGGRICKSKALYYKEPLKSLCNACRQKELDKVMGEI